MFLGVVCSFGVDAWYVLDERGVSYGLRAGEGCCTIIRKHRQVERKSTYAILALVFSIPRGRTAASFFPFRFSLSVLPNLDHALVVAVHTVYSLACFCEHELVDAVTAHFAFKAMCMVRVISGHYCFVEYW